MSWVSNPELHHHFYSYHIHKKKYWFDILYLQKNALIFFFRRFKEKNP